MTRTATPTTLADGRGLIYFDATPGRQPLPDSRPLDVCEQGGEIRFDALAGEWVTIAGHRQDRTFLPQVESCPLCPSSESNKTEIPDPSYEVAIFENRFPSFAPPTQAREAVSEDLLSAGVNAGHCEVVCFTDDHTSTFSELPPDRVELVIAAWTDRTKTLMAKEYVDYVFVFENYGEDIGVTLAHPHGQIYAYPFTPSRPSRMLERIASHRALTGRHLIDDILEKEMSEGSRVVEHTDHWIAFVPFAARWPFQVQLHPTTPVSDFTQLTSDQVRDLSVVYPRLLRRFQGLFDQQVPYIAAWNQAPKGEHAEDGRLFLDLFTTRRDKNKLKYLAGSESAMGAFVNDVSPEKAATLLRSTVV
jgi:UDPglucose--hexose-1-phosphate uridylyltransferase